MKNQDDWKLDNPVWYSLTEGHRSLAMEFGNIRFYPPEYCPFGAILANENISAGLLDYSKLTDHFFIVGARPVFSSGPTLKEEWVCLQMTIQHTIDSNYKEQIVPLGRDHREQLFNLVNRVQPGYFRSNTALLGDYFGIYQNGELVAAAGERMKMDRFVEVSAVVTHPGHVGKGYAKQLVAHTVSQIFDQNKMPFLHVLETNVGAIQLYKKLGFETRRKVSFWEIKN